MKKIMTLLLSLALLLAPVLALGEEAPEAALAGDWYGEMNGLVLQLTLNADGTYRASLPGSGQSEKTGAWVLADGFVYLDGADQPQINVLGEEVLKWIETDIFLHREMLWVYAPAELLPDVPLDLFAGYWRGQFVGLDGVTILAEAFLDEVTALYIEGQNVALGGDFFGNAIVEMAYADGALSLDSDGQLLTLQLQKDGFLRMTIAAEQPLYLYFTRILTDVPEA